MGGMGVLLFFFLSGYGLYKGYEGKKLDKVFWEKRLINMYFPCVVIQLSFYLIEAVINGQFTISQLVNRSLFGAWFIDVILIQYIIFFITGILSKGKSKGWITLSILFSAIIALIFWKLNFNARWYNGLMLFPFGMLLAYRENKLTALIKKQWGVWFALSMVLFGVSGLFFAYFKGELAGINIVKTFSGMCLSLMVCILFMRVKLCSKIMQYMGRKSLYFYLVHANLMITLDLLKVDEIKYFYFVLLFSFPVVESFYQIYNKSKALPKTILMK